MSSSGIAVSFQVCLLLSAVGVAFCLHVGFLFAIVVMPGLAKIQDAKEALHAFQVMDRVIQDNQPAFVTLWLGSIVVLIAATVLGFCPGSGLDTTHQALLSAATVVYLSAQYTTFTRNVPLNNRLQELFSTKNGEVASNYGSIKGKKDKDDKDSFDWELERKNFEGPWVFWNSLRAI